MKIIFDANALIAFANIEPGASVVESYLLEPPSPALFTPPIFANSSTMV